VGRSVVYKHVHVDIFINEPEPETGQRSRGHRVSNYGRVGHGSNRPMPPFEKETDPSPIRPSLVSPSVQRPVRVESRGQRPSGRVKKPKK